MLIPRTTLAVGLAGALALAGCGPEYGPGGPRENTGTGAGLGALVGAGIGAATAGDDPGKSAAIGAVLGAGVGAAIGADLDRQAAELRRDFDNRQIDVENTGDELVVSMPQDILFDFDSDDLRPELRGDLRVMANNLQRYPNSIVTVEGHTDNTGSASYNQDLSLRRAQTVSGILSSYGVSQRRLRAVGKGESEPVATNATAEGRQQNRRVEIIIRPVQQR